MSFRSILAQTLNGQHENSVRACRELHIDDIRDIGRELGHREIVEFDKTDTCPICLCGATNRARPCRRRGVEYEPMIKLHTCKHVFHMDCLEKFVRRCQDSKVPAEKRTVRKVCPVCRQHFSQIRSPAGLSPARLEKEYARDGEDGRTRRETHRLLSNLKITRCVNQLANNEDRLDKALRLTAAGLSANIRSRQRKRKISGKRDQNLACRGLFEESAVVLWV